MSSRISINTAFISSNQETTFKLAVIISSLIQCFYNVGSFRTKMVQTQVHRSAMLHESSSVGTEVTDVSQVTVTWIDSVKL